MTTKRVRVVFLDGEEFVGDVGQMQKSGLFKVQWLELIDLTGKSVSVNLDQVCYIVDLNYNESIR